MSMSTTQSQALGIIVHVQIGSGFSEKHLAAVNTAQGWKQINNYVVQGRHPRGLVGSVLNVSDTEIQTVLHPGIGSEGKIENIFHLAALPEGAEIESNEGRVYQKQGEKWSTPDGSPVEYYHFAPEAINYKIR